MDCIDSITRSILLVTKGCSPPSVDHWKIMGVDSLSYHCHNFTPDSLQITFNPIHIGSNTAYLIITLTNGIIDTLILKGYKKAIPGKLSFVPSSLFDKDTTKCGDSLTRSVVFIKQGCLP